ncbi:hypothetical protein A2G24_01125 [Listeria monocytogenes]|uniref:Uncharacterized protein n=1 Tax=Listeria monocytogenes TaxID=1639 RepID=A0A823DDL9_LISMN|nr:hypothetical protein [Listeria monocytogenes]EAD1012229.1 hypothetical protein [Listeria monocytogenes]EAD1186136.1 hypothetical protein [Listeria monocytogenes]EAF8898054.1 hypothetical protein [Listeria monocytogenes]
MAVNVVSAYWQTLNGVRMTHKKLLDKKSTAKRKYISCERGRFLDENGKKLTDTKGYEAKGMKTGWFPYEGWEG